MTTTPNPTAEEIVAEIEAELDEWIAGTRSWCDQHHGKDDAIELTARADEAQIRLLMAKRDAALRAHGLLSEGAPSKEQIELAALAMIDASPDVTRETVSDEEFAWYLRDACAALTAAGVAPQEPSGCAVCHRAEGHKMDCSLRAAPSPDRQKLIAEDGEPTLEEFERFLNSLCGDEAGDIDFVFAADGCSGWALRGGNDARAVLKKAADALDAPPEVDEEKLAEVLDQHGMNLDQTAVYEGDCWCGMAVLEENFSAHVAFAVAEALRGERNAN